MLLIKLRYLINFDPNFRDVKWFRKRKSKK